jgi:ABC-type antimicrobial peptide transport system permease subunit
MEFEMLASYEALPKPTNFSQSEPWQEFRNSYIYLLLPEKADVKSIEDFLDKTSKGIYAKADHFTAHFNLQALNEIVPGPELYDAIGPEWGYASISVFALLTLCILLPACFNYANISISRALKRMKEIGLRKVMGGERNQIFFQFITETVLTTFVALGLAYYIFILIKAEFLSMVVRSEALDLNPSFMTVFCFIIFALFVGLAAGFVPALYFARLNPIQALKSKHVSNVSSSFSFRKILTVAQFALSLGFIMGVVIVMNQYRQTLNYDFGFEKENILDIELQNVNPEIFRNEFSRLSSVQNISMSSGIIGASGLSSSWVTGESQVDSTEVYEMFVDSNYIKNLGLTFLSGENFSGQPNLNRKNVIVNEEFLKAFKFTDGRSAISSSFLLSDGQEVVIIGVLKNFHYSNLRAPIQSFFFRYDQSQFRFANVKVVAPDDMFKTLSEMELVWKSFGGDDKFVAQFFDDEIKDAYFFYFTMIKICGFLGLLAISISCLGMLGMVVFTVENRMKEVGVRKVMGATIANITFLLSWDFIKLMLVAAMIAAPLTYLFFDKIYLRTQYYKMDIGMTEVIVSLVLMLTLGMATILSQTLKAANANPVDTLKSE